MGSKLSATELRILGTLCEKERTVPDTYPLSLNALLAGCNQKTSRNPVMELSESDALRALESLKESGFVSEVSGGRVVRYAHRLDKALALPRPAAALLTVLILRGPQTAGELRLNCERMHGFADISSVEAYLEEMAARQGEDGPAALMRELPRLPGTRENRWAHTLGEPDTEGESAAAWPGAAGGERSDLSARVAALEDEVKALRELVERLLASD